MDLIDFARPNRTGQKLPGIHIDTFKNDVNKPQAAVATSSSYSKVVCWLLYWDQNYDSNEYGIREDVEDMQSLMAEFFGYEVHKIPFEANEDSPTRFPCDLRFRILGAPKEELHLIYFTGHTGVFPSSENLMTTPRPIRTLQPLYGRVVGVDLSRLFLSLSGRKGHIAFILDCCMLATATMKMQAEVMAATTNDRLVKSRRIVTESLTVALCQTARTFDRPFSLATLHSSIMTQFGLRPTYNQRPILWSITPQEAVPSIVLTPHPQSKPQTLSFPSKPEQSRVLVEIATTMHPPSDKDWKKWLEANIPERVGKISLEGVYDSKDLCILSMTMPIEIWNLLPNRKAYVFVEFVTSSNTLLRTSLKIKEALLLQVEFQSRLIKEKDRTIADLQAQLLDRQEEDPFTWTLVNR